MYFAFKYEKLTVVISRLFNKVYTHVQKSLKLITPCILKSIKTTNIKYNYNYE